MPIKMKSNRSWMMKVLVPFVVFLTLCAVGVSITIYFENDEDLIICLIIFCVLLAICATAALIAKFYKGKSYEFTQNEIICYKRNRLLKTINIANIEKIEFYRYRWWYPISIFFGELPSGGYWSLNVWMKDGTSAVLGFFSVKDAQTLKEKIFGDILTIC